MKKRRPRAIYCERCGKARYTDKGAPSSPLLCFACHNDRSRMYMSRMMGSRPHGPLRAAYMRWKADKEAREWKPKGTS